MEKLFDLLKQHCRKRYWFKDNDDLEIDTDSICFHLYLKWERLFPIRVETVICKEFWFIKWLVENDKINFYKWKFLEYPIWSNNYDECDYLDLIQWLAISDTPIDDLIYYLK